MFFRFTRVWIAAGLVAGVWWFAAARRGSEREWIRPVGAAHPPVRILRFYANVGVVARGEAARLCYGVENARTVTISPALEGVYPARSRCLDILPQHTTHYTLMAEGFDGKVAMRSLTVPVEALPLFPLTVNYAGGW